MEKIRCRSKKVAKRWVRQRIRIILTIQTTVKEGGERKGVKEGGQREGVKEGGQREGVKEGGHREGVKEGGQGRGVKEGGRSEVKERGKRRGGDHLASGSIDSVSKPSSSTWIHFFVTLNTSGRPVGISTSCIRSVGIYSQFLQYAKR